MWRPLRVDGAKSPRPLIRRFSPNAERDPLSSSKRCLMPFLRCRAEQQERSSRASYSRLKVRNARNGTWITETSGRKPRLSRYALTPGLIFRGESPLVTRAPNILLQIGTAPSLIHPHSKENRQSQRLQNIRRRENQFDIASEESRR